MVDHVLDRQSALFGPDREPFALPSLDRFAGLDPHRPVVNHEPISIRGVGPGLDQVLEGEEERVTVIERNIEDDPDPEIVSPLDEFDQCLVPAQRGIDLPIVDSVVAMIGRRREDRVEIDQVDPETAQIIEVLGDADQVTPLEATGVG